MDERAEGRGEEIVVIDGAEGSEKRVDEGTGERCSAEDEFESTEEKRGWACIMDREEMEHSR